MQCKTAVIICRVHPGETTSSYILDGIMTFLLSTQKSAVYLRSKYSFLIVPIVNIEGVYYGYSRTDKDGYDLNRVWETPSQKQHPIIFNIKSLLASNNQKGNMQLFADLHGHSKELNCFLYGCDSNIIDDKINREFIKLFAKSNPYVSSSQSSLSINKNKEGTARVVMYRQFKIKKSFTLEASMYGTNRVDDIAKPVHFTITDYKQIGIGLMLALIAFDLRLRINCIEQISFPLINKLLDQTKSRGRSPLIAADINSTYKKQQKLSKGKSEIDIATDKSFHLPKLHEKNRSPSFINNAEHSAIHTTKSQRISLIRNVLRPNKISLKSIELNQSCCQYEADIKICFRPKRISNLIKYGKAVRNMKKNANIDIIRVENSRNYRVRNILSEIIEK